MSNRLHIILCGLSLNMIITVAIHIMESIRGNHAGEAVHRSNTCSISSCGLSWPPLGRTSVTADITNDNRLIPIKRNRIYQLQNHLLGGTSETKSGNSTPDTPMNICCQFVRNSTLHITYGTGKIENSLISAPTAKAAMEWPLSCKNGYTKMATVRPIVIIPIIERTSENIRLPSFCFNG